jgi:hypothetical protein
LVGLSGNILLGLLLWWHRELFFGWNHGGRQCWGSENRKESPNIRVTKDGETKNLRKPVLASKVVNPFIRALAPPFIGRRRDFYIPRLPSNLENIPSVNMYMNVFYIPWFAEQTLYIYKPATSSHFKPGLLRWRLWLGFSSTPKALFHENPHFLWFPNWNSTRFPNFADSRFPDSLRFILKQSEDLRIEVWFSYYFRVLSEG